VPCDLAGSFLLVKVNEMLGRIIPVTWILSVLAPVASGSVNLHRAIKDLPLDFSLMTSIVGAIGITSQAASVAPNTF
jgi:hypothetical protein